LEEDIPKVIMCFKFGDDRLRGLASAEGQILPSPIDFDGRPYNTLTLPCGVSVWCVQFQQHRTTSYDIVRCRTNDVVRCSAQCEHRFNVRDWLMLMKRDAIGYTLLLLLQKKQL